MLSRAKTPNHPRPGSTGFAISLSEPHAGASTDGGTTSVVSVEGELDLATSPRLKWALLDALDAGHTRLVVDLSLVSFIDSTALGVLVAVNRRLEGDRPLAIVCERPNVLQVFEFAGVDGAFAIFPTLAEALVPATGRDSRAG